MRSIAEIDRDHEGMAKACLRRSHGCTYPACKCDRAKREVPNVRGIPLEDASGSAVPSGVPAVSTVADGTRNEGGK